MAFAFTPQPPIVDWLKDLDAALERSKGFFADRPVALDLSAVQLSPSAITHLIAISKSATSASWASKAPRESRGKRRFLPSCAMAVAPKASNCRNRRARPPRRPSSIRRPRQSRSRPRF